MVWWWYIRTSRVNQWETVINCSLSSWSQLSDKEQRIWVEERGTGREGCGFIWCADFCSCLGPGAPTSSISSFAGDEAEAESDFCRSQANDRALSQTRSLILFTALPQWSMRSGFKEGLVTYLLEVISSWSSLRQPWGWWKYSMSSPWVVCVCKIHQVIYLGFVYLMLNAYYWSIF